MVRNLSSFLVIVGKLIVHGSKLVVAKKYNQITPAERAAIEALIQAAEILLSLLPIPGTDNDPQTFE
jgi:hypothetical protein